MCLLTPTHLLPEACTLVIENEHGADRRRLARCNEEPVLAELRQIRYIHVGSDDRVLIDDELVEPRRFLVRE